MMPSWTLAMETNKLTCGLHLNGQSGVNLTKLLQGQFTSVAIV